MATSLGSVGTISSAGLGSGLDVASIVTQLMAIERRPLDQLATQATGLKSEVSTYGKLQSYFSALRDKSNALTTATLWGTTTATSADASVVTVSTGSNAAAGSYAITTTALARGQTVIAAAQPASTSTLNEGSLTIELGTYTGAPVSGFDPKVGSPPITVAITAADLSLASIRDKINAAGAGVVASIVTDSSGARLSIRSKDTGAENAFRITASETVDDGVATTGLSTLAYDAAGGASQMSSAQVAGNARATINGIDVNSASNTLNNVIDGLTINLIKESATPVNVSVAADTAGIKTRVTEFVSAFNDLAGYLHTQMAYNPDSKAGGALQGDQTAVSLQRALRDVLNQASTASATFTRLSDIGIAIKTDGTLETNGSKLDNALGNLSELRKMLATDGVDSASSGFARRWKNLSDLALGSGGAFESRTSSLNQRLAHNSKDQDAMNQRLTLTEARLRAQYSALDAKMAQLNGLSTYLTQQITALNKSNGN